MPSLSPSPRNSIPNPNPPDLIQHQLQPDRDPDPHHTIEAVEAIQANKTTTATTTTTPQAAAAAAAAAADEETAAIDRLLARYLALLDAYAAQRAALHALQAGVFQHLARANFVSSSSGGGGTRRYGPDDYDERMRARRRVRIRVGVGRDAEQERDGGDGEGEVVFDIGEWEEQEEKEVAVGVGPAAGEDGKEGVDFEEEPGAEGGGKKEKGQEEEAADADDARTGVQNKKAQDELPAGENGEDDGGEKKPKPKPADPLRWFGILTPLPLRQAQAQAIKAVEEIIPRLATLSTAMAGIELEVRRARKRRAKAEKV